MKKTYEAPTVEVVEFKYRDQVVAASGINSHECHVKYTHSNDYVECEDVRVEVSPRKF